MAQILIPPHPLTSDDVEGLSKSRLRSNFEIRSHFRGDASAKESTTSPVRGSAEDMAALLADHRRTIAHGAPPESERVGPARNLSHDPPRDRPAPQPGQSRTRRTGQDRDGGLSQDLHDCGGYHLALLQISLKLLEAFVPEGRGRLHLERTKTQLARFAADLGSLATARAAPPPARPDVDCRDLDAFLTETLDAWSLASGLPVDFRCNRPHLRLPIVLEQPLLRMLQECLTNVLKHARTARRVAVDLTVRRGILTLTVRDDGCGFDPVLVRSVAGIGGGLSGPVASGMGLPGMAARMDRIGGRLDVDSARGRGTRISACLRLPRPV